MEKVTRIALSTDSDNGLDSVVSPHFGRCPFYVLVEVAGREVMRTWAVENPFYGDHVPGAVPGFIRDQGAHVMLTGGMGRRAIMFFEEYRIEAVTGAFGTVRHALQQYLGGELQGAAPCAESLAHADEGQPSDSGPERDEAGRLREEVEALQRQLDEATRRLNDLGPG